MIEPAQGIKDASLKEDRGWICSKRSVSTVFLREGALVMLGEWELPGTQKL